MIASIIVTYKPDDNAFIALLKSYSGQLDRLYIIDNSNNTNNNVLKFILESGITLDKVALTRLGDNFGIARALNIGIEQAMADGAEFVILSDQDSLPANDMVNNLFNAYRALISKGNNVGAIGPAFTDLNTLVVHPFQVQRPNKLFYSHQYPTSNEPHVEALTLITSGTLIPIKVLKAVGEMREDFFIDYVDIEWSHRARSKGFKLFGTSWATMEQRMGESSLKVWYFKWRYENKYPPIRLYYRIRNFVVLISLTHIEWRWKLRSSWYSLGIIYSHVIYGDQRIASMKMAILGFWDGVQKKMGGKR